MKQRLNTPEEKNNRSTGLDIFYPLSLWERAGVREYLMSTERARELRCNQTDAERKLWRYLRNRQLHGYKFRRQMPIGKYIVDFGCVSLKLVVEIDGSQHMQNTAYDESRTEYLNKQGYKVIRFWNNEILTQIESVLEALTLTLSQRERECEMQD